MATPLISWASNNPIVMCLCSQLAKRKFKTGTKTSWPPFDIQRSKVYVLVKHSTKASYTYFLKVLFNNVGIMSSIKTFLDGKFTLRNNQRANICNQMDLTILNGNKTLMTNNIMSSKNLFWVSWSFGNKFEEEKKPEIEPRLIFSQSMFLGALQVMLTIVTLSIWEQNMKVCLTSILMTF